MRPATVTETASETDTSPSDLLERGRELDRIRAALRATAAGTGGLLVVEGPAGIGKTRLTRFARTEAATAGMQVLAARGADLERTFAWGVARQWFPLDPARVAGHERSCVLAGAAALAGGALGDPAAHAGQTTSVHSSLHGLHWLVMNLAQSAPLLLVLDDAHWADDASLRLVAYLAGRLTDLPVVLLVATRPVVHGPSVSVFASVVSDPEVVVLRPGPLSVTALRAVIEQRMGQPCHPEFARTCHAATGGNPFLLEILVRSAVQEGIAPDARGVDRLADVRPQAMSTAVLGRLPQAASALAVAVAVLQGDAAPAVTAELAGLSVEAASAAAVELIGAGLLEDTQPLRFVHALVRDGVLDGLSAGELSAAHARAAQVLRAHGLEDARVAAHLMATRPQGDQSVVDALRAAARAANARGDPAASAAALTRALAEPVRAPGRAALLEELAGAELMARDPSAVVHLRQALAAAPDGAARARVALLLAEALLFANQRREANDVMITARATLGDDEPALALALETQLAQLGWTTASLALGQERRLEHLKGLVEHHGRPARALRLTLALRDVLRGRPAAGIVEEVRLGLDDGRFVADESSESVAVVQAVCALAFVDALADVDRLLDAMSADAANRGSPMGYGAVGTWRAYVALRRGRIADAEAEARAALEHFRARDLAFAAGFATAFLGMALAEQGRVAEAAVILEALPLESFTGAVGEATLREARGLLRLRQGRTRDAEEELRACGVVCEALMVDNPAVYAWRSSLALCLPSPAREEAHHLVRSELAAARGSSVPRAVGVALRAEALLDASGRVEKLRSALDAFDGCPAELERARTLLELGAALRRGQRRVEAREPLHAALELADALGAATVAESARRELRAAGSRPRRLARTGIESLTPQEHRIATLAAESRSNPEIAQALFLSRKTVEMHLGHAYSKLGVASRRDLSQALADRS